MAFQKQDNNTLKQNQVSWVLFVDMNSFFATCEQQVNYWLRHRPVGVCVYTGKFGCVIAPSVEAKMMGVTVGMRLNDAIKVCPGIVPVETKPQRYRDFHVKIMKVLSKYSSDVFPKSIDEAVVDLRNYSLNYDDPVHVAKNIKEDIHNLVGDYMRCSIGIAPNAFLAKFASTLQKPDGLTLITKENIDEVLSKVKLTDLPGIKKGMSSRLREAGIRTPIQLRHSSPEKLKSACRSIVGVYWYYRLNFSEVDFIDNNYKTMQVFRQISREQRASLDTLNHLFEKLCFRLEERLVKQSVFCKEIIFFASYEEGNSWSEKIINRIPIQSGVDIMQVIKNRMQFFQKQQKCEPIINHGMKSMGITVSSFVTDDVVQFELFSNDVSKNHLRKVVYDIKDKQGVNAILYASELRDKMILKDAIGFGSVKDLHQGKEYILIQDL